MKKMTDLGNVKKRKISMNFLSSYLLILVAPVIAIVIIYFTAEHAMIETQKERIQSAISEAGASFDREVKQAQNVAYYVGRERRLQSYLQKGNPENKEKEFFALYTIANNYPNYTLTNQVIKNVFVLIADSHYVMRIPQVIPKNERGISTLGGFPFCRYDKFMEFYRVQDPNQMLFYHTDEEGQGLLLLPDLVNYPDTMQGKCAVVIELDWTQIKQNLRPVLAEKEGMIALLDENNEILASAENKNRGGGLTVEQGMSLETYMENCAWGRKNLEICSQNLEYNGWRLVIAVPRAVLTERIGAARYASVILCTVAVLIGLAVCFSYWYRRKSMVQDYFELQERMEQRQKGDEKEPMWFWRSFDKFLVDVDRLQSTVEKQESLIMEDFLRKLLYGNFDSEEQVMEAAERAGVFLWDGQFCVVDMEYEDPFKNGLDCKREEFTTMTSEFLSKYLPWSYWRYQLSELSVVLIVLFPHGSVLSPEEALKDALEKMDFELYSRFKIQSYTGISRISEEALEISRLYEIASRIKEFARYRGIRIPVLPRELPQDQSLDQPLFFSVDMELKLLSQIQNGSDEQLSDLLSQIRIVYFRPGNGRYAYRHTIEILRGCIFRSIPMEDDSPEAKRLRNEAQRACCEDQIFRLLKETRQFCARNREEKEEVACELNREKVSVYIEENYGNPCLNLSLLAEWLGEPERKLYNDFKQSFGMSFSSFLEQRRITHACELLKKGVAVKETAEKVGYGSDYSFRRAFKRVVGIPPSDFQKMQMR